MLQRKAQQSSPPSTTDKDPDVKEGVAEEVGEWAEYVDSFGRTRRCLKEDLPRMQEEESKRREERSVTPDLMSEDMAQERERRRWEREQAEELDTPVGPVHYEEMRQGGIIYMYIHACTMYVREHNIPSTGKFRSSI